MTLGLMRQRPGDLPVEVTGFVGRERELCELASLLRTARLITVTGPGGVGKTRIALRVAAQLAGQFADGVCLAVLSALHDPELLPNTVAGSLGMQDQDARPQLDAIAGYLRDRDLLLILDTCEHLIDACAVLADLLVRSTTRVTVLATSRQPLDLPGEHTYPLGPLPVPDPASRDAGHGDAVELFAQRAATVVPGFTVTGANRADVIRLCRRLDGIPLAVELATVRLRAVTLDELAGRLEQQFRLLTSGHRTALPHHQTLHAAIEWSYGLCTPPEQLLWGRLSVFAASFDIPAAEAVCADGTLPAEEIVLHLVGLVDKSVVLRVEDADGTRYRLLDTIREFGAAKLASSGDGPAMRDRHLARYFDVAQYFGDQPHGEDQLPRYRELRGQHADIRAALDYALAAGGRDTQAWGIVTGLHAYWQISGLLGEGKFWLAKILDRFPSASAERAAALMVRSALAAWQGDVADAIADLDEGIPMAEQLGEALYAARGYVCLNLALTNAGRYAAAEAAEAAAAERLRAVQDSYGLLALDAQMSYVHLLTGNINEGIARATQGLRRLGPDSRERWLQSYLRSLIALALFLKGESQASTEETYVYLKMEHEIGDNVGMGYALEGLAWLAAQQQRYARAAWMLGAAEPLWQLVGSRLGGNAIMTGFSQQAEQTARDALGEERFAAWYQRGAGCPLDQVIAFAIGDADEPGTPEPATRRDPLTSREREIVALVAAGLSNRAIAEQLVISKRTVDAHIDHIFSKLGVSSRVQLVGWRVSDQ